MPIEDEDIDAAAGKPKSVSSHDGRSVTQHSPLELTQAQILKEKHDAAAEAALAGNSLLGMRFRKTIPPGAG